MKDERIPITILTGFLGSGKTTLLNQLILSNPEKRIAVIENEFASYAFDADIVDNKAGSVKAISAGCICCSQNGALIETVMELVESPDRFDHIIIESTGVADPAAVAGSLFNEVIQEHCYINAVLCTADVLHIQTQLEETDEAGRQIAFADVLLLTKTDTLDAPPHISVVKSLLKAINPLAAVQECIQGRTAETNLLELYAYRTDKMVQSTLLATEPAASRHEKIKSMSFTLEKPFDFEAFNHLLHSLEEALGKSLYRVKGFLYAENIPGRMILQSVADTHCWVPGAPWQAEEKRESKLVFIGKNLSRPILEKYIQLALAEGIPQREEDSF